MNVIAIKKENSGTIVIGAFNVIYASRTYVMMSMSVCLSVRLSVTFVHCGHRVR